MSPSYVEDEQERKSVVQFADASLSSNLSSALNHQRTSGSGGGSSGAEPAGRTDTEGRIERVQSPTGGRTGDQSLGSIIAFEHRF